MMNIDWNTIIVAAFISIPFSVLSGIVAHIIIEKYKTKKLGNEGCHRSLDTPYVAGVIGALLGSLISVAAMIWGVLWPGYEQFLGSFTYYVVFTGSTLSASVFGFYWGFSLLLLPKNIISAVISILSVILIESNLKTTGEDIDFLAQLLFCFQVSTFIYLILSVITFIIEDKLLYSFSTK